MKDNEQFDWQRWELETKKPKYGRVYVAPREEYRLPTYAHDTDAGADIHAAESGTIQPGERKLVGTGIYVAIPPDMYIEIVPRSGLAAKHGVTVLNSPGIIDPGYTDEIMVCLVNLGMEPWTFERGDRIAQMLLKQRMGIMWERVRSVKELTEDRNGGFGSSGV